METPTDVESMLLKSWLYFGDCEFGALNEAERSLIRTSQKVKTRENLQRLNKDGNHIFIRPTLGREPYYLMIDDINEQLLESDHIEKHQWKPGRLIVETSPGNFQAWIRSTRPFILQEKSFWLNKYKSDPGAQPRRRWGRCPGFYNVKQKYKTICGYPWVSIKWADLNNSAGFPSLDSEDFTHNNSVKKWVPQSKVKTTSGWMGKMNPIWREMYEKTTDQSRTDFSYILALMVRGYRDDEIGQLILTERKDWSNHRNTQTAYIERSIVKAHIFLDQKEYK